MRIRSIRYLVGWYVCTVQLRFCPCSNSICHERYTARVCVGGFLPPFLDESKKVYMGQGTKIRQCKRLKTRKKERLHRTGYFDYICIFIGKAKVRCLIVVEVTLLGLILPWCEGGEPRRLGCGAALVWRTGCVGYVGDLRGMMWDRGRVELCDVIDSFVFF